ncbi:MAG TPA: hypothetical protein PK771_01410 [Spirochaetota bacterium]|nr:hypothetical protein [Spirochaetota bacterium]
MEFNNYFLLFPEGDTQEIYHPLRFGDIIDINGNICKPNDLNPRKISYKVTGVQQKTHFKEITFYYRVELLNRNEVLGEISYNMNGGKFFWEK